MRFPIAILKHHFLTLALCLLLSACGEGGNALTQRTQFIMGTLVEITVPEKDSVKIRQAIDRAFDEMSSLENLMSTHRPDSEISRINAKAGEGFTQVSPETLAVLERAIYWGGKSRGALDITLGPVVDLWHFDVPSPSPPTQDAVQQARARVGLPNIEIEGSNIRLARLGMSLHLGAIAKGYAVDRATQILKQANITNFMINAGGDLMAIGKRAPDRLWNIGLQHPRKPERVIATFSLTGGAVATSGDYQRYFIKDGIRYHHILNPKTGQPAKAAISATVRADSVMDADAIATALFVMGADKGIAWIDTLQGVEGMVIPAFGPARYSAQFQSQPGYTEHTFKVN